MHRYQGSWFPGAASAYPDTVDAFKVSICNSTGSLPVTA